VENLLRTCEESRDLFTRFLTNICFSRCRPGSCSALYLAVLRSPQRSPISQTSSEAPSRGPRGPGPWFRSGRGDAFARKRGSLLRRPIRKARWQAGEGADVPERGSDAGPTAPQGHAGGRAARGAASSPGSLGFLRLDGARASASFRRERFA